MKRVFWVSMFVVMMFFMFTVSAYAETKTIALQIGNPTMTVNGVSKEIDPGIGTKPITIGGRTMVPIRTIIENMGGTIAWDGNTQQVTITAVGKTIRLTIGYKQADVKDQTSLSNWTPKALDVAPQTIGGRTMVPLRFVVEQLGAKVDWNAATQTATITLTVQAFDSNNWTGSWEADNGVIMLNQSGSNVTGTDSTGYYGRITGEAIGKIFTGKWFIAVNNQGDLEMTMSEDGKSLTSRWRYNYPGETPDPEDESGGWSEGSLAVRN